MFTDDINVDQDLVKTAWPYKFATLFSHPDGDSIDRINLEEIQLEVAGRYMPGALALALEALFNHKQSPEMHVEISVQHGLTEGNMPVVRASFDTGIGYDPVALPGVTGVMFDAEGNEANPLFADVAPTATIGQLRKALQSVLGLYNLEDVYARTIPGVLGADKAGHVINRRNRELFVEERGQSGATYEVSDSKHCNYHSLHRDQAALLLSFGDNITEEILISILLDRRRRELRRLAGRRALVNREPAVDLKYEQEVALVASLEEARLRILQMFIDDQCERRRSRG